MIQEIKIRCPYCGGTGVIRTGYLENEHCFDCEGTGFIPDEDLEFENLTGNEIEGLDDIEK